MISGDLLHPNLRDFIHHISFEQFHVEEEEAQIDVVPDAMTELVFVLQGDYSRKGELDVDSKLISNAHLIGLKSTACKITVSQSLKAISVRFMPGALCFFIDINMKELKDRVVEAKTLFGSSIGKLEEQLRNTLNREEQIQLIQDFLLSKFNFTQKHYKLLQFLKLVYHNRGALNIEGLKEKGQSYKNIERLFSSNLGINPKLSQQLIQFNYGCSLVQSEPQLKLTKIAHEVGYYDQAHFIRSFQKFAKIAPSQYRKIDSPIVLLNHKVIESLFLSA